MNTVAILPQLVMRFLQRQNVKRGALPQPAAQAQPRLGVIEKRENVQVGQAQAVVDQIQIEPTIL